MRRRDFPGAAPFSARGGGWVEKGFPLVERQPNPEEGIATVRKILAKFD